MLDSEALPRKAKTHKGKLYLNSFLPQVFEEPKQCLFINTRNSSEIMRMVLNDLYLMRKEYSKKLNQKNEIHNIFYEKDKVEFLCEKNNTSLFTYTSDMKKKPMNLVMGCLFNHIVLDAFEFEVTSYVPISYFINDVAVDSYMKPVLIFQGEVFESEYSYERLKKFFVDFFRLYDVKEATISELRRIVVISCEMNEKVVKVRSYQVDGKISEGNLEQLELKEIGPSIDLKERRFSLAEDEAYNRALKQPKAAMEVKVKNIERNGLGEKRGRIHMEKQNLNAMALRKFNRPGKKKRLGKGKEKDGNESNKDIDLVE